MKKKSERKRKGPAKIKPQRGGFFGAGSSAKERRRKELSASFTAKLLRQEIK